MLALMNYYFRAAELRDFYFIVFANLNVVVVVVVVVEWLV
jgi:hypothetical protein